MVGNKEVGIVGWGVVLGLLYPVEYSLNEGSWLDGVDAFVLDNHAVKYDREEVPLTLSDPADIDQLFDRESFLRETQINQYTFKPALQRRVLNPEVNDEVIQSCETFNPIQLFEIHLFS